MGAVVELRQELLGALSRCHQLRHIELDPIASFGMKCLLEALPAACLLEHLKFDTSLVVG